MAMVRRIRIPKDLWLIVGRTLSSMGYISKDSPILETEEKPIIKAILLEKEEWQTYCSQLHLLNPNHLEYTKETEEELETVNSINLFIVETLKRKDLLEQFPEIVQWHIEKGFMGFDNVILINTNKTEETFKEADKAHSCRFGEAFYYTVDSCRLAFLILELIRIYEFRLGKPFTENALDGSILQNKIFLFYLCVQSLHPKDFKLDFIQKSDQQKLLEEKVHQNILKALNQKEPSFLTDNNGKEIAVFNIGELFSIEKEEFMSISVQ
jgi:hypothetical protein